MQTLRKTDHTYPGRHDAEMFGREVAAAHPLDAQPSDVAANVVSQCGHAGMDRAYTRIAAHSAAAAQAKRRHNAHQAVAS